MIPSHLLDNRAMGLLLEYLREEINRALSERRPLEEKWLRYQRMYKAQPEKTVKEFPFYGAANLVLPVVATDVDTIHSRLAGILFGPENLWSTSPLREDAVDYAPRLQEFLKWAQRAELNAYPAAIDWLMELTKLGTGVLKERYRRDQRLVYEFREAQTGGLQDPMMAYMPSRAVERISKVMLKDSPELRHVSLYDFLVPAGTIDHQEAPWNAERILLDWSQIQQRARAGIYMASDRLQAWHGKDKGGWAQEQLMEMQSFQPSLATKFELWEGWVDFDVMRRGEPMPLLCTIHLPSMTYLRVDFNPFFHQEKPYSVARYLRQEKQFYGIGLGEMLEMFQEETTAMHNQRLDSATISNAPMMMFRKGMGIKEDEPVFIGRWIGVNDMDDVKPINFGRLPNSSINDEQMTMSYATKRTGVNDYVMGNSSAAVGYATAQTNIMQHQEAAKRFDQTLREVREALGSSGRRIVELYQQFNQGGKIFSVLGPSDGALVQQILEFPLELIRHSVSIDVTATSASLNKETQIRTHTILMQMVTQYYEQAFQGMQLVMNPQLPPPMRFLAERMVIGGSTMMRRLLEAYDMQDVNRIIPDMQEILYGQQQQLQQLGLGPAPAVAQSQIGPYGGAIPQGSLPVGGMAPSPIGAF